MAIEIAARAIGSVDESVFFGTVAEALSDHSLEPAEFSAVTQ